MISKRYLTPLALLSSLLMSGSWAQTRPLAGTQTANVAKSGDSVLEAKLDIGTIRVVISTYTIEIGTPSMTPPTTGEAKTNCTYSSLPCSQVSNLKIWVRGRRIFVPRSVFADITDVGNMSLSTERGLSVLTLDGGDASESYTLKVFFNANRVKKREVYGGEGGKLSEETNYLPPVVFN